MSNLIQRKVNTGGNEQPIEEKAAATLSEEEMEPLPSCPSGEGIAQDTDEVLKDALKDLNPRWRNWVIRGVFTTLMLGGFSFTVSLGSRKKFRSNSFSVFEFFFFFFKKDRWRSPFSF